MQEITNEQKARLLALRRQHFKSIGFQGVQSDDLIFLIGELYRFYFPSEQKVGYTEKSNTTT